MPHETRAIHETIVVSLSNVAEIGEVNDAIATIHCLEELILTTTFPKGQLDILKAYEQAVTELIELTSRDLTIFKTEEVKDKLTEEYNESMKKGNDTGEKEKPQVDETATEEESDETEDVGDHPTV